DELARERFVVAIEDRLKFIGRLIEVDSGNRCREQYASNLPRESRCPCHTYEHSDLPLDVEYATDSDCE
ncbi:hypothetical protein K0M31_015877, partial [Melipona bicolor]